MSSAETERHGLLAFLMGRRLTSRQWAGFLLSLVLVPSAVYYGVVLKELYPETSFFCMLAVNLLLLLTILASFVRTIAKDPGIVPRRKVPDGMSRSMFGHVQ